MGLPDKGEKAGRFDANLPGLDPPAGQLEGLHTDPFGLHQYRLKDVRPDGPELGSLLATSQKSSKGKGQGLIPFAPMEIDNPVDLLALPNPLYSKLFP
jgi:hypothetical protein